MTATSDNGGSDSTTLRVPVCSGIVETEDPPSPTANINLSGSIGTLNPATDEITISVASSGIDFPVLGGAIQNLLDGASIKWTVNSAIFANGRTITRPISITNNSNTTANNVQVRFDGRVITTIPSLAAGATWTRNISISVPTWLINQSRPTGYADGGNITGTIELVFTPQAAILARASGQLLSLIDAINRTGPVGIKSFVLGWSGNNVNTDSTSKTLRITRITRTS